MCTLSWAVSASGYQLWFNRDEQRSRTRARPPAYDPDLGAAYPMDPDGGGTWIALHRSGMALCLLNYYPNGAGLHGGSRSRGEIILDLLRAGDDVGRAMTAVRLEKYRPFTLCHFPSYLSEFQGEATAYRWDGELLLRAPAPRVLTSSSVSTCEVEPKRLALFPIPVSHDGADAHVHETFHCSHLPARSYASVCMHRSDAETVSLTHISVGERRELVYQGGPPCTPSRVYRVRVGDARSGAEAGPQ